MDPSSERRGRSAVTVLVVVGLLGAVAVAAAGHTPSGGGETRRPSEQLVDTFVSLYLVAAAATAAVVVYLRLMRRDVIAAAAGGRGGRRRRGMGWVVVLLLIATALAVFVRFFATPNGLQSVKPPNPIPTTGTTTGGEENKPYEPQFALVPVLVVLGIAVAAAVAAILADRARRRALPGDAEEVTVALIDVLDETLDDLRRLRDPRRAVIAAYARLERTMAAYGLPRRSSEAPEEYLVRILGELEVGRRSVERLTELYERAKFSHHEVDSVMKDQAIAALQGVRDDIRAAEIRREAERAKALEAARSAAAAGGSAA